MLKDVTYIIGHGGHSVHRLENLKCVIKQLKSDCAEIIVVEQNETPYCEDIVTHLGVKYIFAFNDGMYNRSWGFNIGYKQSTNDIVVVGDNDLIMKHEDTSHVIEQFSKSDTETCSPYNIVIDCPLPQTQLLRQNQNINAKGYIRTGCNYAGGILYFKRGVFEKIGGWDERFEGWGGEDDHFFSKLKKNGITMHTYKFNCMHLYHDRTSSAKAYHSKYKENIKYIAELNRMTAEQCKQWCLPQYEKIGDINKYKS